MDLLNKTLIIRVRIASGAIFGYLWANLESNGNLKCIRTDFFFSKSEKLKSKHLKTSEEEKNLGKGGKKRKGDASDILSSFKGRKNLEAKFRNNGCI